MKRNTRSVAFIQSRDLRSTFESIRLRETVFRKAVTAADVRAGIRPRTSNAGAQDQAGAM